jgi:hypothetical protein
METMSAPGRRRRIAFAMSAQISIELMDPLKDSGIRMNLFMEEISPWLR